MWEHVWLGVIGRMSMRHACRHTDTYDMESSNTPSHTCSHTLSTLLPWPNTPSHPRSLTHRSDVSGSNTPAGRPLIALLYR